MSDTKTDTVCSVSEYEGNDDDFAFYNVGSSTVEIVNRDYLSTSFSTEMDLIENVSEVPNRISSVFTASSEYEDVTDLPNTIITDSEFCTDNSSSFRTHSVTFSSTHLISEEDEFVEIANTTRNIDVSDFEEEFSNSTATMRDGTSVSVFSAGLFTTEDPNELEVFIPHHDIEKVVFSSFTALDKKEREEFVSETLNRVFEIIFVVACVLIMVSTYGLAGILHFSHTARHFDQVSILYSNFSFETYDFEDSYYINVTLNYGSEEITESRGPFMSESQRNGFFNARNSLDDNYEVRICIHNEDSTFAYPHPIVQALIYFIGSTSLFILILRTLFVAAEWNTRTQGLMMFKLGNIGLKSSTEGIVAVSEFNFGDCNQTSTFFDKSLDFLK
ncbi:hypothetical protein PCE1_001576 [Barthelona sp. PCE]